MEHKLPTYDQLTDSARAQPKPVKGTTQYDYILGEIEKYGVCFTLEYPGNYLPQKYANIWHVAKDLGITHCNITYDYISIKLQPFIHSLIDVLPHNQHKEVVFTDDNGNCYAFNSVAAESDMIEINISRLD